MPDIPKTLHFVWVGGPMPEDYIANIRQWMEKNRDYKVKIWTDSSTIPPGKQAEVQAAFQKIVGFNGTRDQQVQICDINGNRKDFFENMNNKAYYMDEVTGANANYAAASDILRLEVLYAEGGVYLDTDLKSSNESLGTITATQGFMKSAESNDFLCSIPKSTMVDAFRNGIRRQYEALYSGDDIEVNKATDEHRSKAPWKERIMTTLSFTGPDLIAQVFQKEYVDPTIKNQGVDIAIQMANDVYSKTLRSKYETVSDQTWIVKEPKSVAEANSFFKDEFRFRLKQCCVEEIQNLMAKKNITRSEKEALSDLQNRIRSVPEIIPIQDVIDSWGQRQTDKKVIKYSSELRSNVVKIYKLLNGFQVSGSLTEVKSRMNKLKADFFPVERYIIANDQVTNKLNVGMRKDIKSSKDCLQRLMDASPKKKIGMFEKFARSIADKISEKLTENRYRKLK